jgi:hypothetical protein
VGIRYGVAESLVPLCADHREALNRLSPKGLEQCGRLHSHRQCCIADRRLQHELTLQQHSLQLLEERLAGTQAAQVGSVGAASQDLDPNGGASSQVHVSGSCGGTRPTELSCVQVQRFAALGGGMMMFDVLAERCIARTPQLAASCEQLDKDVGEARAEASAASARQAELRAQSKARQRLRAAPRLACLNA